MTIRRRELLERCLALGTLTIAGATPLSAVATAWDDAKTKRQPTPWCELGPFYKRQAPRGTMLRRPHDPGMPLAVAGTVYNVKGQLLLDATLEIWQTDNAGHYDNEGYLYRAMMQSDQKGGYAFESIMPGHYPDRVCQHVHYLVTAPGHKPLTTQLYFATDPVFDGDPGKNFKRDPLISSVELVRPVVVKGDPNQMLAAVNFDIVLEKA
jgi:protocatechuate 3,4-dioxygenase beta subunit